MKIAFFTDVFFPTIGGIEFSVLNLSTGLLKNGHEVMVVSPKPDKPLTNMPEGMKLQHLSTTKKLFGLALSISAPYSTSVYKVVKEYDPDIIHFHTPFAIGAFGVHCAKSLHKPLVGTFHSYFMEPEYLKSVGIYNAPIVTKILWKYAVYFYNLPNQVITPTERTRIDIIKHGITKPVKAVTNAVNEPGMRQAPPEQIEEMKKKFRLKKRVVVYVGRLAAEKSIDILIKSMKKICAELPETSLCIVGKGPAREELEKLSESLGLKDCVKFVETKEVKDLLSQGYYQLGDVFASASKSETQGMTFIEAMYFGIPLVAVAERGADDVVRPVGLLAKPDDVDDVASKILSVLRNDALRKKLGIQSRKTYEENYSFDSIVHTFEDVYSGLLRKESKA